MINCAAIFTEHMVLQRDERICIWGECNEGEIITVELDGIKVSTRVASNTWKTYLPAHQAGGPYTLSVTSEYESIEITDVMYGEVFLAAGQSNMEMSLMDSEGGQAELEVSDYPDIRYYNVLKTGYIDTTVERRRRAVRWELCQGKASGDMSAVAYYAAKKIHKVLKVPVGIIDCYQGGTSISSWLPVEILERYIIGKKYIADYRALIGDKTDEEYELEVEEYWKSWHAWDDKVKAVKAAKPNAVWEDIVAYAGECPWPQPAGRKSVFRPAGCYHTMLKTIAPYTLSGILYYQGETDAENALYYYDLMQALIYHWRSIFENSKLYFVITQLPMFTEKGACEDYSWAVTREVQLKVYENIRNVGLLSLADMGEYGNIHPNDKKTPGERLGELVLQERFKTGNNGRAMLPDQIIKRDGEIIITLDNTCGGIVVKDVTGSEHEAVFEVAEDDGDFEPCQFKVKGTQIILNIDKNMDIRKVRYGWRNYCEVNIFNNVGIPLVPFGERWVC